MLPRLDYLTGLDKYVFGCIAVLCMITAAHGATIAGVETREGDVLLMHLLILVWVVFNSLAVGLAWIRYQNAVNARDAANADEIEEENNAEE